MTLSIKIKSSLMSQRPATRIGIVFDKKSFDEGLKTRGMLKLTVGGIEHCMISSYSKLDSILGCS